MATKNIEQKLAQLVQNEASTWKQDAEWRIANQVWLDKSAHIAMQVLDRLEELDWSQKQLAEKMNTTPQYISKLCKGHENLTLKNIAALENALSISIDTQSLDNFVNFEPIENISVHFTETFFGAVESFMKRLDIQFDEVANHVKVSAKPTLTMPLSSSSANCVKKEVEDFAMSA